MLKIGEFGTPYVEDKKNARGKWTARVKRRTTTGYKKLSASGVTKADARAALAEKMAKAERGGTDFTMDQVAELYVVDAFRRARLSSSTIGQHRDRWRDHGSPRFGKMHPAEITRAEIHVFLSSFTKISPAPILKTLSVVFKHARLMGLIDILPTVGSFELDRVEKNPQALPPETLERIAEAFAANSARLNKLDSTPRLAEDVYEVLLVTGIRIGEALALRKCDYDPQDAQLTIAGTMSAETSHGGTTYRRKDAGKTAAARRILVVPEGKGREILEKVHSAASLSDGPLFPSRNGTFISGANYRRRWRAAIERFAPELKGIHPHLVRHTVATHIVRRAVDQYGYYEGLERSRQQLGHGDTKSLLHYLDRTDLVVDNSDLLSTIDPRHTADDRTLAAVQYEAAKGSALAQYFGVVSGRPAYVIYDGDLVTARAEIDKRFAGSLLILTVGDPAVGSMENDDGSVTFFSHDLTD